MIQKKEVVLQQLKSLQEGLEKLAQGDFNYRIDTQYGDEFNQLAAAFNGVVGFLQETQTQSTTQVTALTAELNQQNQKLTALEEICSTLQEHNRWLVDILKLGHLLQQNLNPASLFQEIVQAIHSSLGYKIVVLSLVDETEQELRPRAYVGLDVEERQLIEQLTYAWEDYAVLFQEQYRVGNCYFFPHDGIIPPFMRAEPESIKLNAQSDGNYGDARWHPDDALLVPIELRPGQLAGIFSLSAPEGEQRPNLETLQALEVFASQTATAIENARLYGQVQRDLIERKRTAKELARLNEQLEDRVKERTLELARTNESLLTEIQERQRAEEKILASLKEKEMLLQEIHHRVKNNLQVVSSLLNLQAGYINNQEIQDIFRESNNRVRSMALVHEKLYRSADLARVDLAEYIRNLATFLFSSYQATAGNIALKIETSDVFLGIDVAVPCGLMLNELISNALKHAFPNAQAGQIKVNLQQDDDQQVTLIVADDGIGLPPDFDIFETDSLGMKLVETLVDQLDGTLDIQAQAGTQFKVTFPIMGQE